MKKKSLTLGSTGHVWDLVSFKVNLLFMWLLIALCFGWVLSASLPKPFHSQCSIFHVICHPIIFYLTLHLSDFHRTHRSTNSKLEYTYTGENRQHLSFYAWINHLSWIFQFYLLISNLILLSVYMNKNLLCVYQIFCIHASNHGHLGWFHVLAIVKREAMSMYLCSWIQNPSSICQEQNSLIIYPSFI